MEYQRSGNLDKRDKINALGFNISGNLSCSFYFEANYMVGKAELLTHVANGEVVGFPIREVFREILHAHDNEADNKIGQNYEELKRKLIEGLTNSDYRQMDEKEINELLGVNIK
ncbi:MAG: hypothetical protein DRJ64_08635 [Thermoprotei archaeon]|nr:MAG: hypothetical protein DRJ64_08635 [Thermoprotei archaeon]